MKLFLITRKDSGQGCWDITVGEVIAADDQDEALSFSSIDVEMDIKEIGVANDGVEKGLILDDYKRG